MNGNWGRFTVAGSVEGESAVRAAVRDIVEALQATLHPSEYRSVELIGGYGRGEGGVERVNGKEVPHNNLDLLVITRPGASVEKLREKTNRALDSLRSDYPFGIDVGAIEDRQLKRAPCLVMWYDMRHGHKTLLGDPDFVPSLKRFSRNRIEPSDIRNLLVNRGTLLVINGFLLENEDLSEKEQRTIIRHAMKAIIGYGDALLFFEGWYHWSYQVKKERMRTCHGATPSLRELYDEATAFRFQPRYGDYMHKDLWAWNEELLSSFAPIHLACEARRLGAPMLNWDDYVGAACRHALIERATNPRAWARKVRNYISSRDKPPMDDWTVRLGYRCLDMRGRLALLFPFVAYRQACNSREAPLQLLGVTATDSCSLRRAYLRSWETHGDPNFSMLLHKLGRHMGGATEQ